METNRVVCHHHLFLSSFVDQRNWKSFSYLILSALNEAARFRVCRFAVVGTDFFHLNYHRSRSFIYLFNSLTYWMNYWNILMNFILFFQVDYVLVVSAICCSRRIIQNEDASFTSAPPAPSPLVSCLCHGNRRRYLFAHFPFLMKQKMATDRPVCGLIGCYILIELNY